MTEKNPMLNIKPEIGKIYKMVDQSTEKEKIEAVKRIIFNRVTIYRGDPDTGEADGEFLYGLDLAAKEIDQLYSQPNHPAVLPERAENPYPEWESLACQYHPKEWLIWQEGADAQAALDAQKMQDLIQEIESHPVYELIKFSDYSGKRYETLRGRDWWQALKERWLK